jgi:hypothetical protein
VEDPYDPALVRSAPHHLRRLLADALAEEATARIVSDLGMGYTVWHDVAASGRGADPDAKIDHIVLGPSGLWGMLSEDWGDGVATRRGEIIGPGLRRDERPLHDLASRARRFERLAKVKFSALAIVIPDDTSAEGVAILGSVRGATTFLVQRPRLAHLIGARPSGPSFGGTDLFEVRTRVQSAARFV